MKQVASLQYGVIFKKAFSQPDIFSAFVKAVLGIEFNCENVETEKSFKPIIGNIDSRFDLFAEDKQNRVIVDIQHRRKDSHYDRFLHYHCAAILEQMKKGEKTYRPHLAVYTIVVLTSVDKYQKDVLTIDFDPKDLQGKGINEIPHKIIYLCPKCVNENTPTAYKDWLQAIADTLDEEVDETQYSNAIIQKVFTAIQEESITAEERYQRIEEHEDQLFLEIEKQESLQLGKKQVAKNLLALQVELDLIVQATGLTIKEIEDLKNND